jgi:hypothetical protein
MIKQSEALIFDDNSIMAAVICLLQAWKLILFSGFFGVAIVGIYLTITPKKYETHGVISPAKILQANDRAILPIEVFLEDRNKFLFRLKYLRIELTKEDIQNCELSGKVGGARLLTELAEFYPSKEHESLFEFRIRGSSKEKLEICAKIVLDKIEAVQNYQLQAYIQKNESLINQINQRLIKLSKSAPNQYYLHDEVQRLSSMVEHARLSKLELINSIQLSIKEAGVSRIKILTVSFLMGLLIGVVLATIKNIIKNKHKYKN